MNYFLYGGYINIQLVSKLLEQLFPFYLTTDYVTVSRYSPAWWCCSLELLRIAQYQTETQKCVILILKKLFINLTLSSLYQGMLTQIGFLSAKKIKLAPRKEYFHTKLGTAR
jgi:hypothetical protein